MAAEVGGRLTAALLCQHDRLLERRSRGLPSPSCSTVSSLCPSHHSSWEHERTQLRLEPGEERRISEAFGPLHFLWLPFDKNEPAVPAKHLAIAEEWQRANPTWQVFFWTTTTAAPLFQDSDVQVASIETLLKRVKMLAGEHCSSRDRDSVATFLTQVLARNVLTKTEGYNAVDAIKHFIVWTCGGLYMDLKVRLEGGRVGQLSPLFAPQCRNAKFAAVSHFMGLQGTTSYATIFENQVLAFPKHLQTMAKDTIDTYLFFHFIAPEAVLQLRAASRCEKRTVDADAVRASTRRWFRAGASAVRRVLREGGQAKLNAECFFDSAYTSQRTKKRFRLRGLEAAKSQFAE